MEYYEDDSFTNLETEYPAIVFNDTFDATLSWEPTVSPLDNNEIDFEISFDESDDEDYMVIFDENSFSCKIIFVDNLKKDSENENDKVNTPSSPSPEPTIGYIDDLDFFKDFENEFLTIAYNDLKSKSDPQIKPSLRGVRRMMKWRQFILALGLHTKEEMAKAGFRAYWSSSGRVILDKGDLRDYWMEISYYKDFLGPAPSYVFIRDPVRRLCHMMIACSISGSRQASEKVTIVDLFYLRSMNRMTANVLYLSARYLFRHAEGKKSEAMPLRGHFIGHLADHFRLVSDQGLMGLSVVASELPLIDLHEVGRLNICLRVGNTWAWVAPGPERQQAAAADTPGAAEDAHAVDKGVHAVPAPVQAPQPPPPAPQRQTTLHTAYRTPLDMAYGCSLFWIFDSQDKMSRGVTTVGSTMRIPLLYRGEYSHWRERFMNYLEEQTDGEAMINSIQNGDQPLPVIAQVSLDGNAQNAPPTLKDPRFWTVEEKKIRKIDRLARSLLIQGLPNDIYSLINSNETAKDLWDALERKMLSSEYEWKQYGILMRQTKNLMDINIDALYNILKQNQGDVNDALGYKKKAIVVTSDPLALVAEKTKVTKRKEKVEVQSESEESDDEDISDLKKITALLAKAFNRKKYYAKPTNNNLKTSSASSSANKKPEYVKSVEKKEDKKADEKKRDMSKVKCYNCKKEGHFAKDCKKAKVKDYNYYKKKMLLAKKDSDEQALLAEDQAWMESSSDSDQEINGNMVFMAQIEKVLSDLDESSSSAEEIIAEVAYYTSESESEFEYETSEYYDNSTNYGLFVNNDDDQEIFHDAIESASENFIENHIDSEKDYDRSEVDHNDFEEKEHLVNKLIWKFNHKIAKCEIRIEKANKQSKDLENQNKNLQEKYNVLINQVNTFVEQNNEFNEQIKVLNEKNADLLAQTKVLQDQLKVKHVVIDTHTECQAQYAKLEKEIYEYKIRYYALCDNDKQHRKRIDKQEILFDKMSRQLVEMNNNVLRLQEKIIEKETKISKLEGCVSNKYVEIEKCLERLNECVNKLHKIRQKNQTIHMIMPSKDTLYNGRKGIGFENPSYFEKAKDLRPSLMMRRRSCESFGKEKPNLKTIESLKSKGSESSENAISESENQSENDYLMVEKECDKVENPKNVKSKLKRKRRKRKSSKQNYKQVNNDVLHANTDFVHFSDLDTFSSVRRPKNSDVIWKKKWSSNTSNVDLSSVSVSKLNKNVKRYSRKDLLSCNNSHLGETSSAYICNGAMNVSYNSRLCDLFDENNLFIFNDESVRISPVSKMPFRKKPRDSLNIYHWIIDSGCSKHMTGNRALLTNFVEKFLGTVCFGNNDFAVIAGYGDVVIGSMKIKKVYYVEGLGHNLFSVGQFCDKGLE
nr:integrase, catalytic region, zinc finger, CCHC-type, peptidase aspartic, catalytic [Tanacetum cinerariifolium]